MAHRGATCKHRGDAGKRTAVRAVRSVGLGSYDGRRAQLPRSVRTVGCFTDGPHQRQVPAGPAPLGRARGRFDYHSGGTRLRRRSSCLRCTGADSRATAWSSPPASSTSPALVMGAVTGGRKAAGSRWPCGPIRWPPAPSWAESGISARSDSVNLCRSPLQLHLQQDQGPSPA